MYVYRARNKETVAWWDGGAREFFKTEGALKQSWRHWDRKNWPKYFGKFDNQDVYEIVKFELVEVKD